MRIHSRIKSLLTTFGLIAIVAVMLAMTSVIVMRIKAPDLERPFRIPLYPIPPLVSLGIGGWLVVSATIEDWQPVMYTMLTLVAIIAVRPLLVRKGEDGASEA